MACNDDALLFAALAIIIDEEESQRRFWVDPWNHKRDLGGLIKELRSDEKRFKNFTRMTIPTFDYLLEIVSASLHKTSRRQAIKPEERLLLTLRFLATGERFKSLSTYMRTGDNTLGMIVKETVAVIWEKLQPLHMPTPTTESWAHVASQFEKIWNYPNCCGAIDSKHVRIESPKHSGSMFHNYKGFNSIVLQAVADADAKFIAVDVGDYGRNSDGGVFSHSAFGKLFNKNALHLPPPRLIDGKEYPYVFVADEAYALSTSLMRPFARRNLTNDKRIYNYRHSRARRIVECAFGMLTKKFRVFESAMLVQPQLATNIIMACCVLHNMIRDREGYLGVHDFLQQPENITVCDSQDTAGEQNPVNLHRGSANGYRVRNQFVAYFLSENGKVPWQNHMAHLVEQ